MHTRDLRCLCACIDFAALSQILACPAVSPELLTPSSTTRTHASVTADTWSDLER